MTTLTIGPESAMVQAPLSLSLMTHAITNPPGPLFAAASTLKILADGSIGYLGSYTDFGASSSYLIDGFPRDGTLLFLSNNTFVLKNSDYSSWNGLPVSYALEIFDSSGAFSRNLSNNTTYPSNMSSGGIDREFRFPINVGCKVFQGEKLKFEIQNLGNKNYNLRDFPVFASLT